jgi:uncharacterized protein YyaL (SSP411 family)
MLAVDFGVGPSYEVVVAGNTASEDTQLMLHALRTAFLPNKVVILRPLEEDPEILRFANYVKPYSSIDGTKATAYVCRNYICSLPTTEADMMLELFE